ncbi:MAG: hypothetical protein E7359_03985 [Clostridiales bacterium]|nr:hypothetical protein [Clostridiales bacterium]
MKKVLSIVALSLIAVLAGVIILFACIDKSYNPNITEPDYIQIYINKTSGQNTESYYKNDGIEDRKAVYDEVLKLYNKSFNQKIMSGIFQGILFNDAKIVRETKTLSTLTGTYIAFNYEDLQTLKLNGKTYTYKNGSTTETNIQFKTLWVEVKDSDAMTDINIYVEYYNQNSTSETSRYKYVVKAMQSGLYNYIQENFGA